MNMMNNNMMNSLNAMNMSMNVAMNQPVPFSTMIASPTASSALTQQQQPMTCLNTSTNGMSTKTMVSSPQHAMSPTQPGTAVAMNSGAPSVAALAQAAAAANIPQSIIVDNFLISAIDKKDDMINGNISTNPISFSTSSMSSTIAPIAAMQPMQTEATTPNRSIDDQDDDDDDDDGNSAQRRLTRFRFRESDDLFVLQEAMNRNAWNASFGSVNNIWKSIAEAMKSKNDKAAKLGIDERTVRNRAKRLLDSYRAQKAGLPVPTSPSPPTPSSATTTPQQPQITATSCVPIPSMTTPNISLTLSLPSMLSGQMLSLNSSTSASTAAATAAANNAAAAAAAAVASIGVNNSKNRKRKPSVRSIASMMNSLANPEMERLLEIALQLQDGRNAGQSTTPNSAMLTSFSTPMRPNDSLLPSMDLSATATCLSSAMMSEGAFSTEKKVIKAKRRKITTAPSSVRNNNVSGLLQALLEQQRKTNEIREKEYDLHKKAFEDEMIKQQKQMEMLEKTVEANEQKDKTVITLLSQLANQISSASTLNFPK